MKKAIKYRAILPITPHVRINLANKYMIPLLAIIIGGMGVVQYQDHGKITSLQTQQSQIVQQVNSHSSQLDKLNAYCSPQ